MGHAAFLSENRSLSRERSAALLGNRHEGQDSLLRIVGFASQVLGAWAMDRRNCRTMRALNSAAHHRRWGGLRFYPKDHCFG